MLCLFTSALYCVLFDLFVLVGPLLFCRLPNAVSFHCVYHAVAQALPLFDASLLQEKVHHILSKSFVQSQQLLRAPAGWESVQALALFIRPWIPRGIFLFDAKTRSAWWVRHIWENPKSMNLNRVRKYIYHMCSGAMLSLWHSSNHIEYMRPLSWFDVSVQLFFSSTGLSYDLFFIYS